MSASPTSPVLKLDHSRSDAVNLAVLQQKDAAVVRVLGTAKHCTLYDFDGRWTRKGFEGTLFIVERSCAPRFQVVVLNRLSPVNFVKPLNGSVKVQVQPPYLILKIGSDEIVGIWFHSNEERDVITELVKAKAVPARKQRGGAGASGAGSGGGAGGGAGHVGAASYAAVTGPSAGKPPPPSPGTSGKSGKSDGGGKAPARLVPAQAALLRSKAAVSAKARAASPAAPASAVVQPVPAGVAAPAGGARAGAAAQHPATPAVAELFARAAAGQVQAPTSGSAPSVAPARAPPVLTPKLIKATMMALAQDDAFVNFVYKKAVAVAEGLR